MSQQPNNFSLASSSRLQSATRPTVCVLENPCAEPRALGEKSKSPQSPMSILRHGRSTDQVCSHRRKPDCQQSNLMMETDFSTFEHNSNNFKVVEATQRKNSMFGVVHLRTLQMEQSIFLQYSGQSCLGSESAI